MPSEFRSEFEGLVIGADAALFADPAALRRIGDRRTTRNRVVAVVAAGVAVLAAAGAIGTTVGRASGEGPNPGPGGLPTIGTTAPPASVEPSATPTAAPTSAVPSTRPPAATGPLPCTVADLDPRPYYGGGVAAGSSYTYVVVRNTGALPCLLRGLPRLVGTDGDDTAESAVAVQRDGTVTDYLVPKGGYAQFGIRTVNGNPYSPGAPECVHPVNYHDLALILPDGRFEVRGLTIRKECGPITETGWERSAYPNTGWENMTRAPA